MKKQKMLIILSFSLLRIFDGLAQEVNLPEYPSAREVHPQIMAETQKHSDGFEFLFRVSNGNTALQDIWIFMVEIRTDGFSTRVPPEWSASNIKRDSIKAVTWGANDFPVMIKPGSQLSGFSISSAGLPSVVRYFAAGYLEPPEGELDFKEGTNDVFYNSAKGFTIGPTDAPTPFVAINFLDIIISYKHQARDLGWIDNQGVGNSLDAKLDSAKKYLDQGQTTLAINELEAFVNEVEAQKDTHLNSEAYALLKYNADYLIAELSK